MIRSLIIGINDKTLIYKKSNYSKVYNNEDLWQNLNNSTFCYDYLKGERIISKYGAGLYEVQSLSFDFFQNLLFF